MSDFEFLERDIYPLNVVFVNDNEGGYLIEEGKESDKYRPSSFARSLTSDYMYFEMMSHLTYKFTPGEFAGQEFYTRAKLIDSDSSLHFFGTSREIEEIEVLIYSDRDKVLRNNRQLKFTGELGKKYNNYFIEDTKEHLSISLLFPLNQFEQLFRLWDSNNIEKMFLNFERKIINGLYILDTLAPDYEYKILWDRRMIKNHHELPEQFTDFNNFSPYYVSEHCFNLTILKSKSLS